MADKLNNLGFSLSNEELKAQIGGAIPTRLHLALCLRKKGVVKTLGEAFKKFLSPGKPAYLARFKYTIEEAISLIKGCGGISFLAHPHLLPEPSWVEEIISQGIQGLEVIYPRFSSARIAYWSDLADKFNLLKSGGSDAHGSYKKFTGVGDVTVPYAWVERMKDYLGLSLKKA